MKFIVFIFFLFSYSQSISNITEVTRSIIYNKSIRLFSSQNEIFLGQISGLATSIQNPNQLTIFHRGSRKWNEKSFPDGIHFDNNNFGPIHENTIITIDIQTGQVINQWGNKTFYMPHGLFIDNEENIWLTDVAMHQVFKYSNGKIELTLGELFVPGDDHQHFCKPTDVILSTNNLFLYIADGYCNSRILKFNSNGTFIKQYKIPNEEKQLFIPHSLTLIESHDLICVADRQNQRIVCFDINQGNVKYIIENSLMNNVYAITYNTNKNLLYAVTGKDLFNEACGFTYSVDPDSFGHLIQTWKPTNKFGEPHDLALSIDGDLLFVGEIHPNRIHVFNQK